MTDMHVLARQAGFTLVEMLVALLIGALLIAGLNGITGTALANRDHEADRIATVREADFAMQRMTRALGRTTRLMVPRRDNPATGYSEALRNPGVLAMALDAEIDRDNNGIADADNDGDGLVDEDAGADLTNDQQSGIKGIDDDNDGAIDETGADDDDEDDDLNGTDEDPDNGLDDDGDGEVDEDPGADMNGDGFAGVGGVDDDNDSEIDETSEQDDDEDEETRGKDEDWVDAVVYFINGSQLIERMPNLAPTDGRDYTERVIANSVSSFEVELNAAQPRATTVRITIAITGADGETVSLTSRTRIGGLL